MKSVRLSILFLSMLIFGCSVNSVPKRDISNARLAIAKVDTKEIRRFNKKELKRIKQKFKKLNQLLKQKKYLDAKYLAREIEADARLIEVNAKLKEAQHRFKLQSMSDIEKIVEHNISKKDGL